MIARVILVHGRRRAYVQVLDERDDRIAAYSGSWLSVRDAVLSRLDAEAQGDEAPAPATVQFGHGRLDRIRPDDLTTLSIGFLRDYEWVQHQRAATHKAMKPG